MPYWEKEIQPQLKAGKTVFVAAHGNSIRAIVKFIEGIADDDITGLEIPTGTPLVYDLDEDLKPIASDLAIDPLKFGRYLGDAEKIKAAGELDGIGTDLETSRNLVKLVRKAMKVKGKELKMPLRICLTGRCEGPAMGE